MPSLCYKESDHLPTILYPPLGNGRLSFKTSNLPTKKALITFKPTICKRKKLYLSPKTSTSNSTQGVVSFKICQLSLQRRESATITHGCSQKHIRPNAILVKLYHRT